MHETYQKFSIQAKSAAEEILDCIANNSHFTINCHYDADGITAAGIIAKSLSRQNANFHLKLVKQMDQEIVDTLSDSIYDTIILGDIGSGYLDLLKNMKKSKKIFILDHHQINGDVNEEITQVNPHLHGIDGGKEISGAGVTYFVAKSLDEKNIDLSPLAVVGAVADMQDKNEKRELDSLNSLIVNDAIEAGLLKAERDLIIYGRETRPIHKALSHTMNPFLPGLSGQEDNCFALLSSLSIPIKDGDRWRTIVELSNDEKKKILSAIVEHMTSKEVSASPVMTLIGTVYTLINEDMWTSTRDAREYATLLNACGRMDRPSLGVAICMGERGSTVKEVANLLSEHRKSLASYISLITEKPENIERYEHLAIIHSEEFLNENMTGAISSLLSSSETFEKNKVIIVLAKTKNGEIKLSARGTDELIEKGLNLGIILQTLAKRYNGNGGGHKIAAGAQIPESNQETFLSDLRNEISRTLSE
ncbi:DHHA1 domain-containing protein [Thermoproteota archaeon]